MRILSDMFSSPKTRMQHPLESRISDIDPENLPAIRHHHYPRKRLYVPNEDDARMFPGIGPGRYTVVAKSAEHIVDNRDHMRDRCLRDW